MNQQDLHSNSSSPLSLCHHTITTGNRRQSPRCEVGEDIIKSLMDWLKSAKPGEVPGFPGMQQCAPVPDFEDYIAMFYQLGDSLMVTLVHYQFGPCVAFGIALTPHYGTQLWHMLGGNGTQPTLPWCGVRIEPGLYRALFATPDGVGWMGDFERCVAWAWIDLAGQATC